MGFVEKLDHYHGKIAKAFLWAGGVMLLFITLYLSCDVIGRYIFNRPLPASFSIGKMLLVCMTFLSLGYVQRTRGNIELDFLAKHFSPLWQGIVDVISPLIGLLVFGLTVYGAFGWSVQAWRQKEFTEDIITFPTWPSRVIFFIGILFLCVTYLMDVFKRSHRVAIGVRRKKGAEKSE